ncbi:EF hand repeat-containing protein (plasmid) [Crinalium epipsammum PCC 9333]|uniref:EF hand repeat-containing protein n=1 Tax=Crinalium epipsammum PCC 9333 TaxID=1173022 RepID=K9W5N3_9CYAN|nr:EF-hand domain-containing protein [Crinalium epipsammum]AFZ15511.1 EF hand repeat-containing protein [Crinalium epipsammum PCC 9333]
MLTEFQKRKLNLRFYMVDISKDGIVELADFEQQGQKVAELMGIQPGSTEYDKIISANIGIWQTYWKGADADGDNKITVDEYLKFAEYTITAKVDEKNKLDQVKALFDAVDLDGSGEIELKEYTIYLKAVGKSEEDAKVAFSKLDADGDGKLSRDEFALAMIEYHRGNDPQAPGNWFFGSY